MVLSSISIISPPIISGETLYSGIIVFDNFLITQNISAWVCWPQVIAELEKPLYFDKRVGRHGKPIKVLKFTSMKHDADTNPERYLNKKQMKQWKKERKVQNDPRVTKFGKILRKTSIDELPQLFNILVGTLSLVGPRPITESELMKNFTPQEREKLLLVKPGLTGNWAVSGRNNVEFKDHSRQALELEYIDKISFKTDTSILLRTFGAVLRFNDVK